MGVVLIAGGSSGIGLAALRAFRAQGDSVLLADIDGARAAQVAAEPGKGEARAFACDLSTDDGPRVAASSPMRRSWNRLRCRIGLRSAGTGRSR